MLLVYFACHGTRKNDGKPRLVAEDTRDYKVETQAIAIEKIEHLMRQSGAKRLVLMIDACHMGVGTDGRETAFDPDFVENVHELAEGFVLLTASTHQQIAYELGGMEHGLFSYYVLKGLAGEAKHSASDFVTVNSLKQYLLHSMKKTDNRRRLSAAANGPRGY